MEITYKKYNFEQSKSFLMTFFRFQLALLILTLVFRSAYPQGTYL